MTTIMPESERLRKAVTWISEEAGPDGDPLNYVNDASMRFNLSPKESDYLTRFFKDPDKAGHVTGKEQGESSAD